LLKPGQQAKVGANMQIENNVDLEQVVAWKNGYFHFQNASVDLVLQELGRWYDMDIVYQGAIPKRQFGGEISRSSTLQQVLKILEESNVKITVSGKNIVVQP
jgi:transmembrane sensor